jgi:hypothetical protein
VRPARAVAAGRPLARLELALRAADRLALHPGGPGRPAQCLHLVHLGRLDARHRPRRGALIIVLSIMNGFQKEVRNRMLSLVSHVEVVDAGGAALADWRAVAAAAKRHPRSSAPRPSSSRRR